MSEIKWQSGAPPHEGWWCADEESMADKYFPHVWRWWDGFNWSAFARDNDTERAAYFSASMSCPYENVVWCDYWPEHARVPRIDPRNMK